MADRYWEAKWTHRRHSIITQGEFAQVQSLATAKYERSLRDLMYGGYCPTGIVEQGAGVIGGAIVLVNLARR